MANDNSSLVIEHARFLRNLAVEFKEQFNQRELKALLAHAANLAAGRVLITTKNKPRMHPKPTEIYPRAKLKEARLFRKLTQTQVAEAVGITPRYYSMIEGGSRSPSLPVAREIAKILACTTNDVLWLGGSRNKNDEFLTDQPAQDSA